jgi:hypothetical protein
MQLPPTTLNVERAAAWSWRLLVSAAAVAAVLALLWYLRDRTPGGGRLDDRAGGLGHRVVVPRSPLAPTPAAALS